ncbi:porin family protein [Fulvivirga kasyanovii]|uniref:PorT family protein n=1 Tax=Fulvivirga kasyanovii TaxID=396812 RepID=A0ABW9RLK2_9BACT|nr:porin family protein [Fulvivirga kasyanovii]MTI24820.1 PorT family protein [Fulvivirga kasyanovii]
MKLVQVVYAKALLMLFCVSSAFAQEEATSATIEYGFKAGAVMSELSSSYHTGSRLGFTAGAFGSYQINDMLAVQAEVAYFQSGGTYLQFKDESRFGGSSDFFNNHVKDASVTLHNIYVPVQARFAPFSNPAFPKFLIGPYMSYNISATESYQKTGQLNGNVFVTAAGEDVVSDQYKNFQFGAVAGLQFDIPTEGSFDLVIGAAYQYGITPVKESFSYIDFVEVTEDVTANAFSFTVGVKF